MATDADQIISGTFSRSWYIFNGNPHSFYKDDENYVPILFVLSNIHLSVPIQACCFFSPAKRSYFFGTKKQVRCIPSVTNRYFHTRKFLTRVG
jgi:hypothetical protein